jgi:hypothetical protein
LNTSELLILAARAGVTFWLDGDRLAYRAPKGRMTTKLREEVILHKADLIAMLQQNRLDTAFPIPQGSISEENEGPLASGQERLWLIERRIGPSPLHNVHFRLLWKGVLDQEILALSIREIVVRHAALRTTFTEFEGTPRAIVSPDAAVELEHLDLRDHGPDAKASTADSFILDHQRTPFDLEQGPLMRTAVITLADDDHILLVTQHHLITDGWSVMIFLTELGQGYRARCLGQHEPPPAPPLRYSDYVRWQHEWRDEEDYQERLSWWKEHITGLSPLELLSQQRMPPGVHDYNGASQEFSVPAVLSSQLKNLAREQQCTLYTLLLTAWAILLHRYADQDDFAVGTITNGRDRMEFQNLIGFFANTVVLRCDLSGNPSATDAIARVRAETESALEHEVPFADALMAAGAVRDTSLTPLIQAAFMFQGIEIPDILNPEDAPRIAADLMLDGRIDGSVEGTTKFDLSLTIKESHEAIKGYLEYAKAQFSTTAIQRLSEHFLILLESIAQNPHETIGRLKLISKQERRRLLGEWSHPEPGSDSDGD